MAVSDIVNLLKRGRRIQTITVAGDHALLVHAPGGFARQHCDCYLLRIGSAPNAHLEAFETAEEAAKALLRYLSPDRIETARSTPSRSAENGP